MIAFRLTKWVEIPARGTTWRIAFTNRVLLHIEELTGVGAMQLRLSDSSARLLRAVLFAVFREAGAEVSLEEAGKMLRPGAMPKLRAQLVAAWAASMPEPEPVDAEESDSEEPAGPINTLDAWARARFDLRLSDEEWLSMTPRMLHALAKRRLESVRQFELMVSILCAHTVNHSFHAPKVWTNPRSYMPHPWPESEATGSARVTGETLMGLFSGLVDKPRKGNPKT